MATDRRFGPINKFGTSSKFGASSGIDGDIRWVVEVDWDNDGVFDGSNEAFWLLDAETFIGRRRMFRTDGLGLEPMEPGRATITLDNSSRRYDPYYSSSALYPNVRPDRLARVRIYYPTTGNFSDEIYGFVRDIQNSGTGASARTIITIEDRQSIINALRMPMKTYIGAYTPSELFSLIAEELSFGNLNELGTYLLSSIEFISSTGDETYAGFIRSIVDAFFGYLYFDGAGTMTYRNLGYSGSSARDFAEADLSKEIYFSQPWENIRNLLHLKMRPIFTGPYPPYQTVYNNDSGGVFIAAGQTLTFYIRYSYNGAPTACAATDLSYYSFTFTANANIDGSGANLTANFTINSSTNLGYGGVFNVTNSGGTDGYLFLTVDAMAYYEMNGVDIYYPEDPTSVSYPHELFIDSKWYQYFYNATDVRDALTGLFDSIQKFVVVELEANPAKQFFNSSGGTLALLSDVTLTSSYYGLSSEPFVIGGKQHRTVNGPQYVRTTLWLEPVI